jgi:hypothetical protein
MFKSPRSDENHAECGLSEFLQVVGFVAIFNEANYSSETRENASFYS